MPDPAAEFLQTFNEIHKHLRQFLERTCGVEEYIDFGDAVSQTAPLSAPVKFHESYLRSAARLRNAIVHEPKQLGRVIADPRPDAVEELRFVLAAIAAPPPLLPDFKKKVFTCDAEDSLQEILATMRQSDFSQIPVYSQGEFSELATVATVARWLATESSPVRLDDVSVGSILRYTEDGEHFAFLAHDATVYDAADVFETFAHRGKYLDAILVTRNAARDEEPQSILTPHDFPRIRSHMSLRGP